MCGICGFVTKGIDTTAATLVRMNTALRHRGPDDEGYFCIQDNKGIHYSGNDSIHAIKEKVPHINPDLKINAGMGFRRLSILDLSEAGHQPMLNETQTIALTFNGQIYNYRALREILEQKGFHFKSTTDTEVILRGYECWGKDVVLRLNGMFAFAIMDLNLNTTWLVRDRIGLKPLYYHHSANDITWASEMKAILKATWVKAAVNPIGLTGNYYLQTTPAPMTCFENIRALLPATWLEIDLKTLQTKEYAYWDIPVGTAKQHIQLEDAAQELDARIQESVRLQLNADVPVIAMMSGGIDSTTITAMGHQMDGTLKCYSFGIDGTGAGIDELPQAKAMAQKLGIEQLIHMVKMDDVISHLDADLRHYEEPYTAPEVMLSPSEHLGKMGYKVLLSGNGADEVFGGYGHFLSLDQWRKRRSLGKLEPLIPGINPFLKKVKNYMQVDTGFKYYANSRACMRPFQIKQLLHKNEWQNLNALATHLPQDESRFENEYEALFYFEMKYSVGSHHVFRDDLSAMRHSVEMRYPYLDHTIVEWVAQLPLSIRYNGKINKPLLRATAAHHIEDINLSMPKKGFTLPLESWWHNNKAVRSYMETQLEALMKRGIFNNNTIKEWKANCNSSFELSKIWQLVTTELWLQTYID
jgi:asparagine synthase (glutamine-hydrolysing)